MSRERERLEVDACVFDAYGTLFDVHSAAARFNEELGGERGEEMDRLSQVWRSKQVQYTWLRSLMGRHADFWQVTGDALDFAIESVGANASAVRSRLMEMYLELEPYPEVAGTLARLQGAGVRSAILSNGTPQMLAAIVERAGLERALEAVLSVEEVGVFKPAPAVYQLAVDKLDVPAERVCFLSANGWDAAGAAAFGFQVVWVNRFGQARERLPGRPVAELESLAPLCELLGV